MTFIKQNNDKIKLDFWLKDLKSTKTKTIIAALYAINHIKNPDNKLITNALENLLTHGEAIIRHSALVAVLEYDNGAIDKLLPQIKLMTEDSASMVRETAVIALGRCKSNTENELKKLLNSKHSEIRYQAVISVAEKNYTNLAKNILNLLNDSDHQVRMNAAIALGDMKFIDALPQLVSTAKNDRNFEVRYEAALSSGYLGDNSVVPILLDFIKQNRDFIPSICDLLGNLQHPDIEPAMKKIFSKWRYSTKEKLYVAAVLAKHKDDSVKNFMISKLKSFSFETKITAIDRLAYTQKQWAIDALLNSLNTKDELYKDSIFNSIMRFFSDSSNKTIEHNIFIESVLAMQEPVKTETLQKTILILEKSNSKQSKNLLNLIHKKTSKQNSTT